MVPRLRELFRQGKAEVVSNSKNKILATWELFFLPGPVEGKVVTVLPISIIMGFQAFGTLCPGFGSGFGPHLSNERLLQK